MKVIRKMFGQDIIAIEESEMDQIDWSRVKFGCFYLDIYGKIHLEINNKGFRHKLYNSNPWHLFVRQDLLYKDMPFRLLNACVSRPVEELIGARQFIYIRKSKGLLPSNVGILSWNIIKERGDKARNPDVGEVRKGAFKRLFGMLDEVARRLGADFGYFPTATIPQEKMERYGCFKIETNTWRAKLSKRLMTFPLRGMKVYLKDYRSSN